MPLFAAQFLKYVIVGVFNTAIDFSIFNALSIYFGIYSGIWLALINSASAGVVIVNSYFWNKYWTFKANGGWFHIEFTKFVMVNLGALAINTGIVYAVTTYIDPFFGATPLVWENIAKSAALAANIIWNFLGFKYFVFRVY